MNKEKSKIIRPALVCIIVMTIICGIIYPAIVTVAAQLCFKDKANGSIIRVKLKDGNVVNYGSEFIAQEFTEAKYIIGRPMTETYGPTNLSPVGGDQDKLVKERINWWHELDPQNDKDIPMDLLTVSGSGVDPHISVDAAQYQVGRIARERSIKEEEVRKIIFNNTKKKTFGVLGEDRVNVLMVNLELDGLI
ncbi:MAG: K(+)-transporting ATPase subunit C [Clostridium sp.]